MGRFKKWFFRNDTCCPLRPKARKKSSTDLVDRVREIVELCREQDTQETIMKKGREDLLRERTGWRGSCLMRGRGDYLWTGGWEINWRWRSNHLNQDTPMLLDKKSFHVQSSQKEFPPGFSPTSSLMNISHSSLVPPRICHHRGIYSSKVRILFPGASNEGTMFLP